MATEAQLKANAQNAKKSKGPTTPEGKARSSQNALKHGLRSGQPVLRTLENPEDWKAHLKTFIDDAKPVGDIEFKLAEKAAMCLWLQSRAELIISIAQDVQIETKGFKMIYDDWETPGDIQLRSWIAQGFQKLREVALDGGAICRESIREAWLKIDFEFGSIETLQLYHQKLEGSFYKAFNALERRRIEREKKVERAERLEYQRWKDSLKMPRTPTLATTVQEFDKFDEIDIAFLLKDDSLEEVEQEAVRQIHKERKRRQAMAENRAKLVAEAMGVVQELDASEVDVCEQVDERLEPKLAGPEYRTNGFFDGKEKLDKEHPEYEWFNMTEDAVVTKVECENGDLGFRRRRILGAESVLAADHQPRASDEELGSFVPAAQVASELTTCVEHSDSESRRGDALSSPSDSDSCRPDALSSSSVDDLVDGLEVVQGPTPTGIDASA